MGVPRARLVGSGASSDSSEYAGSKQQNKTINRLMISKILL